jgi:predicted permease
MHEHALWRLLRTLLPKWYRATYANDVFRTHLDASRGKTGLRFWLRLTWDVLLTSVQLRMDGTSGTTVTRPQRASPFDVAGQNLRLAIRGLINTPSFTIAVVLTLALGIGANTTMFTILDRLLLSAPAHIVNPEQVRRISIFGKNPFTGETSHNSALTYPDYRALTSVTGFAGIAARGTRTLTLTSDGVSQHVSTEFATASYFPVLGVKPALGRFFSPNEDKLETAEPVAVLSYGFWQRQFGGSPEVLGRKLDVGKGRYTVIGVAPRGFTGIDISPVDFWLPFHPAAVIESGRDWVDEYGWYWFDAIARVQSDRPVEPVVDMATARYLTGLSSGRDRDASARVVLNPLVSGRGPEPGPEMQVAQALGALAFLVLLIACANVANLFLARGLQRRKQYAVLNALGIGRAGLIAQVMTEAFVLAALASVLAYYIATIVAPTLFKVILVDAELARVGGLRVLLMTFAATLITVLLAGLIPAFRSSQVNVLEALRSGRSSLRLSWLRRGLLTMQAALSVILLVGAGLFLRSLNEAHERDLGLFTDALTIQLEMNGGIIGGDELQAAIYPVLERLQQHPLVESAAATSLLPFNGLWGFRVRAPDADSIPRGPNGPMVYTVTADYFRTLGIPLLRGRGLTVSDDSKSAPPVAVISELMARRLWPGREALGRCLLIGPEKPTPPCTTVVGIVGNVLPHVTAKEPRMFYYLAPRHVGVQTAGAQALVLRVKGNPDNAIAPLRSAAQSAAPGIRFVETIKLADFIEPQLRSWRLGARLLTAFGLLALIVAASGLYSLLAFDVTQRRFELGLRSALGAPAPRLIRATVGEEILFACAGVLLGLIAAFWLARAIQELLFQVKPADPMVYAGVLIVLLAVSTVAAALPAWRAARADPRIALRSE